MQATLSGAQPQAHAERCVRPEGPSPAVGTLSPAQGGTRLNKDTTHNLTFKANVSWQDFCLYYVVIVTSYFSSWKRKTYYYSLVGDQTNLSEPLIPALEMRILQTPRLTLWARREGDPGRDQGCVQVTERWTPLPVETGRFDVGTSLPSHPCFDLRRPVCGSSRYCFHCLQLLSITRQANPTCVVSAARNSCARPARTGRLSKGKMSSPFKRLRHKRCHRKRKSFFLVVIPQKEDVPPTQLLKLDGRMASDFARSGGQRQ